MDGRETSNNHSGFLKSGAGPNPDRRAWVQRVLLLVVARPSPHAKSVSACSNQSVLKEYHLIIQKLLHSLEEQVQYGDDGRSLKRVLGNAYWHKKHPMP